MHDLYQGMQYGGEAILYPQGIDLIAPSTDPLLVRLRIGMVFQKPNPFPKSIYENVAAGLRVRGIKKKAVIDERVEQVLIETALWDEVKDRLHSNAYGLSGGQQQRLCIARALAPEPRVILMDEPTSSLDPIAVAKIENLIAKLKKQCAIIMVTHNMQQAFRIADYIGFLCLEKIDTQEDTKAPGRLIEFNEMAKMQ